MDMWGLEIFPCDILVCYWNIMWSCK